METDVEDEKGVGVDDIIKDAIYASQGLLERTTEVHYTLA